MSNAKKDKPELKGLPEPEFRKRKRGISIVWLVPLVALAIGGWLVYKAVSEKGPTITITFSAATGLEAGKTKIKYKDVELGVVDSIELDDELSQVILKAELVKKAENFLSKKFPGSAPFFPGPISNLIRVNPANRQLTLRDWRYLRW
jgi:paraquat-inducible protein B